jgi:hypothetical protein
VTSEEALLHRIGSSFRALALTWGATTCLVAVPAYAQSNSALAETLFLDGQKLMEAGDYPAACAKFTESQRVDPALGTLMHMAACHEKVGKVATAWSEFSDAAAQAQRSGQMDREKFARAHAQALDAKLQKMIIEVSHPAEGTVIRLDGLTLPSGVLGTEIPLDPGEHTLEVTAPHKKPWRQDKLNLGPSAVVTRVQVTLEDDAGAPPDTGTSTPPGPDTTAKPSADQVSGAEYPKKRYVGFGLGVAGIASLVIGAGEEVTSAGRKSDEGKYPSGSSQRQTVGDQSSQAQTYAIIFGAAGLVAVGAGVYLVLTAHGTAPAAPVAGKLVVTPVLGPGTAGAGVSMAW